MFSAATKTSATTGYQISRSLRFNSADSAYLNRTPASASNQKTWTWSAWTKVSKLDINQYGLFSTRDGTTGNRFTIGLQSNNTLIIYAITGGVEEVVLYTTQVFRDPSAWYHIVVALDTTQATASNRVKLYVNGSQVTSFSTATYPTQNINLPINQASEHNIGKYALTGNFVDGYMTEINFVNGQALTPSSFGQTNAQTGVWEPVAYSGSYGTNGFYLNFSDNSNTTAATLGKDYSGNGNNWTPNNFSVSAGAGNDSLVDSPTSYGTDTGAGGTVRGNYATMNPLQKGSTVNIANGNLDVSNSTSGGAGKILGTIGVSSGKWYAEATMSGGGGMPGIAEFTANTSQYPGGDAQSWGYNNGGDKYYNGSNAAYGASFTTNDVIGLALDMDAGSITFYKNGVSQGVAYSTGISGKTITFAGRGDTTTTESWNFGQRPFAYTAPSGYKALCTQNLPTPAIGATSTTQAGKYFNPVLFNKSSFPATIDGVGFQPDLTWWKDRNSGTAPNFLMDTLRGSSSFLSSNSTAAADTQTNMWVTNSDGWTSSSGAFTLTNNYVAWNWKANGAGSSNTAGSITSTVSANTTSGFSVVTYTGTGSGTATIGHGLGVAPSMIIVKFRNTTSNWSIYHASVGNTKRLVFTTAAEETGSGYWNNTTPTSTVFTLGTDLNQAYNFVAYCFAPVAGYSAFGSYTGNGSSDGPFVFCGFRPKYVLIKNVSSTNSWWIYDTARSTYNLVTPYLEANTSNAENTSYPLGDILSNGFKVRNSVSNVNGSGETMIFAAFAEFPFKYTLAR
jgi:SPRY domain